MTAVKETEKIKNAQVDKKPKLLPIVNRFEWFLIVILKNRQARARSTAFANSTVDLNQFKSVEIRRPSRFFAIFMKKQGVWTILAPSVWKTGVVF